MVTLCERIDELVGENVFACYQCGRCSGGCPMVESMDLMPSEAIRRIQMDDQRVLDANTPWVCATCFVCTARCPRSVDIARIMEGLREIRRRRGEDHALMADVAAMLKEEGVPQMAIVAVMRKLTA